MIERIFRTNLDLRHGDRAQLDKFNKLEETPAVGTLIHVNEGLTLKVVDISYRYIDAHCYRVVIEVHLPNRWKSIADFQKVYGVPY